MSKFERRSMLFAAWGLVAALVAVIVYPVSLTSGLLSWGYFVRSVAILGLGLRWFIERPGAVLRDALSAAVIVGVLVSLFAWTTESRPRVEYFDADLGITVNTISRARILGLPLFGRGQVNTFAVFLALCAAACLVLLAQRGTTRFAARYTLAAGLLAFTAVSTSSRAGLLCILVCLLVFATHRLDSAVSLVAASCGAVLLVLLATAAPEVLSSVGVPARGLESISLSGILSPEEASNGRFEITSVMLGDVARSPIFGTGFQDLELFHPELNASPHNQYLGAFHKAGLIGGIIYFAMAMPLITGTVRSSRPGRIMVLPLLAASISLDLLTTPVTAALAPIAFAAAFIRLD